MNEPDDSLFRLDEQQRAAQRDFEEFKSKQNEASKKISTLKDPAEKQAAIG